MTPRGLSPPSSVARAGLTSLVFRFAQGGADFLVLVVTARELGAQGRGTYALAAMVAGLAILPFAGASVPFSSALAHARAAIPEVHGGILVSGLLAGAAMTAGLLGTYAIEPDWEFVAYAAVAAPFLFVAILQQELYRALGAVRNMSLLYLGMSLASLFAFCTAAVVAPGDTPLALWSWSGSVAAVAVVTAIIQGRTLGVDFNGAFARARHALVRGFPFSVANGVAQLNYRVDVFVVAAMLPLADVGQYSVAIALGEALWQVSRAIVTGAYAPLIMSTNATSGSLSVRVFRHALLLLAGGAVVMIAAVYLFAGVVFGAAFEQVWIPLALLAPGIVIRGAAEVLQPFLLIRLERSQEWLRASIVGVVINLVLAVVLVPSLGIAGAALSTTVSYAVCALYLVRRFHVLVGTTGPTAFLPGRRELTDYVRVRDHLKRGVGAGS